MDSYSVCRFYHSALLTWWNDTKEHTRPDIIIPVNDIPIASLLIPLFKSYPPSHVLLLSIDGRIGSITRLDDPAPPSFRTRRYMKVENKSSITSIKNVIQVLYQLLSIDIEEQKLSLIDFLGLLQFIINVQTENVTVDVSSVELFTWIRKQFYEGPDCFKHIELDWRKEYRDPIISIFYDQRKLISTYESNLERLNSCYRMIGRLSETISLQDERISWLEEIVTPHKIEEPGECAGL